MISIENTFYLLILLASLSGPLLLSFDKKVAFFSKFKLTWPAILWPAILYIGWDALFTNMSVWSFADKYTLGLTLIGLPIEEVLFFFIIPYCSIFVYEVYKSYFPGLLNARSKLTGYIALMLIVIFFVYRGFPFNQLYTSWVSLSTLAIVAVLLNQASFTRYWVLFGMTYLTVLIPKFIVNGILTSLPIVIYNDSYFSGIRLFSIPFEDFIYFLGLFLLNIRFYEYYLRRRTQKEQ